MGDVLKLIVGNGAPILAGCLGFFRPMEAARIVGCVLIVGGAVEYLKPIPHASFFGVPFADSTNTLFIPGIDGRNTAADITTLTLAFLEERRALGFLVAVRTLAGWSVIGILMATNGSENVFVHARNIVVLVVISFKLLTPTIRGPCIVSERHHGDRNAQ